MAEQEKQQIAGLVIDQNQRVDDWNPAVGYSGVTRIERADENGEMARVPWFAIYVDDKLVSRVNGKYVVEVCYV